MLVKKGSFIGPTATGNFDTTGIGFQPIALILFAVHKTATDGFKAGVAFSYGFATSSTQRKCITLDSSDNVAASTAGRTNRSVPNLALAVHSATGLSGLSLDFVSFLADGFRLNATAAAAGSNYEIHYIAIGGSEVTGAFVGEFTEPTATGNFDVSGVGFQPDFVLAAGVCQSVSSGSLNGYLGAFASTTQRGACAITSQDSTSPSNVNTYQRSDKAIVSLNSTGTGPRTEADFVSWLADGFRLNYSTTVAAGSQQKTIFLALKGGRYWVGSETQKTSAGTKAKTGVGFTPKGLFMFGTNRAASSVIDSTLGRLSMGASDGTTEGHVWIEEVDAQTTTDTNEKSDTLKAFSHNASQTTVLAEMDVQSFDADGFTSNWTTADATAREFIVVGFGPSAQTMTVGKVTTGFVETFEGSSLDATKLVVQRLDANHTITVSGGTLNISVAAGFHGYARVETTKVWDFTGGEAVVQVAQWSPDDAGTERSMYLVRTNADGTPDFNNGCYWAWVHSGVGVPTMEVWEIVNGVYTQHGTPTAPPAGQPWFRIRESAGTLYFDYSSDGTTWTNFTSYVSATSMKGTRIVLEYGMDNNSPAGGTVKYDNLRVTALPWSRLGGITASGSVSLPVNVVMASAVTHGANLSTPGLLLLGKGQSSESVRGASIAGAGSVSLATGKVASTATIRGATVLLTLGLEATSSLTIAAEGANTLTLSPEATNTLTLNPE